MACQFSEGWSGTVLRPDVTLDDFKEFHPPMQGVTSSDHSMIFCDWKCKIWCTTMGECNVRAWRIRVWDFGGSCASCFYLSMHSGSRCLCLSKSIDLACNPLPIHHLYLLAAAYLVSTMETRCLAVFWTSSIFWSIDYPHMIRSKWNNTGQCPYHSWIVDFYIIDRLISSYVYHIILHQHIWLVVWNMKFYYSIHW